MSPASSSYSSDSVGPDFHIPDEVLSVIPTDPYDQLDLARKITSMAIASRVSNLESQMGSMSQKVQEKDRVIADLEEKVSQFDRSYQENEIRLKMALEENVKLQKERDSMASYAKKLNRDLTKLETLKRQLIQSLNDENPPQVTAAEVVGSDKSVYEKTCNVNGEGSDGFSVRHSLNGSTEIGNKTDNGSIEGGQRVSITPYITPRLTPSGTPKNVSISGSPKNCYTAGSGVTSPTGSQFDGRSSWYSSSQQSSAAGSPSRGRPNPARPPRVDGKEFFRQARSGLSYEQFSAFLANIKELNAQKQSVEETLRKAEEIFGSEKRDLYVSFQGLLNRSNR